MTPLLATNTCAASLGTLPTVAVRHPDAVVVPERVSLELIIETFQHLIR